MLKRLCSKCKLITDDFTEHAYKKSKYCRKCFREYNKKRISYKIDKYYSVYYIPEEHYVGVSNHVARRIQQHKLRGKITNDWEVIAKFERQVDAHWFETLFHMRGYNGYRKL